MDMNNFLQSEATQFVGTAAANTIGLVIGTIHEDIKELLECSYGKEWRGWKYQGS